MLGFFRYAYTEETGVDFDEEGVSLTSSVANVPDMMERKEKKASTATDHVVGLGDVLEEDKQG